MKGEVIMTNINHSNITYKNSLSYTDCESIQKSIQDKTFKVSNDFSNIERGQIYIADLGVGTGSEQGGIRPVLVVQNDKGNRFSPTITIVPITTATKRTIPTHINLPKSTGGLAKDSTIVVEQMRTIDKSRLGKFIGKLPDQIMNVVNGTILIQIGLA